MNTRLYPLPGAVRDAPGARPGGVLPAWSVGPRAQLSDLCKRGPAEVLMSRAMGLRSRESGSMHLAPPVGGAVVLRRAGLGDVADMVVWAMRVWQECAAPMIMISRG